MTKNSQWQAEQNQFDNCTKNSKKRMHIIAADHDAKLQAQSTDNVILTFYDFFHPKYISYTSKYSEWMLAKAAYKASTRAAENLWQELRSDKIENWDIRIQVIYRKDSPEYLALLPNGRGPFQTSAYELRISAVETLIGSIGDNATLVELKADVEEFYAKLVAARNNQQGKEGLVDNLSQQLEQERVACAQAMYYTLGGLMQKYYQNTELISGFYDMDNIRQTGKDEEEPAEPNILSIEPLETKEAGITFDDTTRFMFTNTGTVPITIFTGGSTPEAPESPFILEAGEETEKLASELGEAENRYLYLMNNNPDLTAGIEILLV
ncbi:MAG: hypothetical protein JEY97_13540 [Bacteroidales bacterium]|nr:hypothetical protein [Bacteroidales bacterium]